MSPLLVNIDKELGVTSDPVRRGELLARRACALARQGLNDDASKHIAELRRQFGDGHSGRAMIWIMIAEGLNKWFGGMDPVAYDRLSRAQLLSGAMGYADVNAIASAWKAHIEFDRSSFAAMYASIDYAYRFASADNHDAHARLSIILSGAAALCGEITSERYWFNKARHHAVTIGDQLSIEALQYNRAAFIFSQVRGRVAMGDEARDRIADVRRELSSASTLRFLVQTTAHDKQLDILDARLMLLEGRFEEAAIKLVQFESGASFVNFQFEDYLLHVELAYCLALSGRVEDALNSIFRVKSEAFFDMDVDDQLFVAWMEFELSKLDPRFGDPNSLATRLGEMKAAYQFSQDLLKRGLQGRIEEQSSAKSVSEAGEVRQ